MTVAVIADIVGSRDLPDRRAAQRDLEAALDRADDVMPASIGRIDPLRAVVGDELQGTFVDLRSALAATLLQRLSLPSGIDLRFGIGIGDVESIPSTAGVLSEGPAWWSARAAIEHVEMLARRELPHARTWVQAATGPSEVSDLVHIANAGSLTRERLMGRWSDRVRRLVYGRLTGATQDDLATREGISQSAVSQSLATAGAATIMAAYSELVTAPGG
ncbi:SatD family protein [Microbacterium dextranolyticum]|uniref:SatD family protein n=1 Tax=Microbacterium dextranolyticum TaxID=36806 RepID=A0A9W6HPN2_9MICO|nr:SatD family protein [Microbacterium dextranolyticum]MBM7462465.1 hypothetical protein [Microbacterium dextranolyticum]GLJ96702.1 hypothetical protein GCM10017591_27650 [Microbacterium dextranolyticum]